MTNLIAVGQAQFLPPGGNWTPTNAGLEEIGYVYIPTKCRVPDGPGPAYTAHRARNCYEGHGGVEIDDDASAPTGMKLEDCQDRCTAQAGCMCVTYDPRHGKCWARAACVPSQFDSQSGAKYDVYVQKTPRATGASCQSMAAPSCVEHTVLGLR